MPDGNTGSSHVSLRVPDDVVQAFERLVFRRNHKIHQKGPVGLFEHPEPMLKPFCRVKMLNHLNASKH
jgi:hypothetical protein